MTHNKTSWKTFKGIAFSFHSKKLSCGLCSLSASWVWMNAESCYQAIGRVVVHLLLLFIRRLTILDSVLTQVCRIIGPFLFVYHLFISQLLFQPYCRKKCVTWHHRLQKRDVCVYFPSEHFYWLVRIKKRFFQPFIIVSYFSILTERLLWKVLLMFNYNKSTWCFNLPRLLTA